LRKENISGKIILAWKKHNNLILNIIDVIENPLAVNCILKKPVEISRNDGKLVYDWKNFLGMNRV
jgi:hypothetical protein